MSQHNAAERHVPLDDLVPGEWYCFVLDCGEVIGRFAGFIAHRGQPLEMVVPGRTEVISFRSTGLRFVIRHRLD